MRLFVGYPFVLFFFFFSVFFVIMHSLFKVQKASCSASYGENKTYKSKQITKEGYGIGKYPHSRGVLLRGAQGQSNSRERIVIQLIRKESLHKFQERKTSTRYTLIKPRQRKTHGTRGAADWGERGERAGKRGEW